MKQKPPTNQRKYVMDEIGKNQDVKKAKVQESVKKMCETLTKCQEEFHRQTETIRQYTKEVKMAKWKLGNIMRRMKKCQCSCRANKNMILCSERQLDKNHQFGHVKFKAENESCIFL